MGPDTAFTLQNMPSKKSRSIYIYTLLLWNQTISTLQKIPSENYDLYVPFCYEKNTAFTLQNMPFENQDLYLPLCYETKDCLYFTEYALSKSRSICTLFI